MPYYQQVCRQVYECLVEVKHKNEKYESYNTENIAKEASDEPCGAGGTGRNDQEECMWIAILSVSA